MERFGWEKEAKEVVFLDPQDGFREKRITVETRRDPITGVTAHVVPFRFKLAEEQELTALAEQQPPSACPFCPERFELATPRFTPDVIPEGRFRHEAAVLFPNAFPYEKDNAVAIFSGEHAVGLDKFEPAVLRDGFLVCRDHFRRLVEMDPALRYCSINWNYMPPAGGGLIHPHLQTLAGREPTAFMSTMRGSAARHREQTGSDLWPDLLAFERERKERFIASTGCVDWATSFCPRGMAGDSSFFFRDRYSFLDLSEADIAEFSEGLLRVFRYLKDGGLGSFNLALYAPLQQDDLFLVQGRIIPRFRFPPLGTSDINYFEKLHDEIICIVEPEEMATKMRAYSGDE